MLELAYVVVSLLNVAWFSLAFHYFSIRQVAAARVLVPRSAWDSPLFATIAAAVRFLGGMNLAFAALALLMASGWIAADDPRQRAALLLVLALAHGSQLYFNVPIARGGGRRGDSLWDVDRGPMRLIFTVDFTLMVANAALCLVFALRA